MVFPKSGLPARFHLIGIITIILVVGFLGTNAISYRVSKQSLREAIVENELPLTSNNIYSEIQRDLLRPVFVASLMANDTFVKDWLIGGEHSITAITRYLEEIRREYDVFTSFLISDRTKNYYHFSGLSQVVSESDPRDAWYFRVRDLDTDYEINVDYNAEQGDALTIFINHKVFDYQGNFLAATGVGLKFDTVANIIDRYKENFERNVYFIDHDGRVTVRSAGAVVTEENIRSASGIDGIAEAILSSDQGFFEYERGGETMLVTARHIPELDWWVLVEQNEDDALAAIQRGFLTNTAVGLGVIALTILIISYTINLFHARLEAMATTDKLTGIANRQVFDFSLDQALKRHKRDVKPFSVIMLDVDHFKRINDRLGHLEGDRVIRLLAEKAAEMVRESDVLCRWGGEELIVLAHGCGLADAESMAEKIRAAVEAAPIADLSDGTPVTLSAGVTEYREGDDADSILGRADSALYKAKEGGRNRVVTG